MNPEQYPEPQVSEDEYLDLGTGEGEIEQTDNGWHEGDPEIEVDQTPEPDYDDEEVGE